MKAGEFVDIHVNRDSVANFEWDMVADGIEFSLISADLQADIEAANYGKIEGRHSLTKFNTYEEIKEWAAGLAAANDNAKIVTYGTSYEGRDLWSIEIGTGSKVRKDSCHVLHKYYFRLCLLTVVFMHASGPLQPTANGSSMSF